MLSYCNLYFSPNILEKKAIQFLDFIIGPTLIPRDQTTLTRPIRFLCLPAKCNFKGLHTQHLFDETSQRDICSLNALLASYTRNGQFSTTWTLFSCIHRTKSNLNAYTFTPVLGACRALPRPEGGRQVHGLMIKTGAESGTVAKTAVMDMYSKYGYLEDSVRAFEEMEFKDVVTWNALLSSFLRHGLAREALGAFEAMREERVEISEFTLCSLLKACASLKASPQGKQVHGMVVVMGRDMLILGTALIDFYSAVGCISEAMKVFSGLNWRKDDAMFNSLVAGCVQNQKYKEALSIMSTMKPNVIALTSALAACSENSNLWIGKQIHCMAMRHGFTSDTQMCNVFLDMYAKCGKISNARSLFNGISNKDVVSWTSMIDAYGSHGNGLEALDLFKRMVEERSEFLSNSVTFLALLSACGHSGLVEQGRECFNSAPEKYGLDLGPEHYVCFMDMLGRAGQIDEVWCVFQDMVEHGIRPTAAVWSALLNACGHNLDVTRGEVAAKHLLELEPNKPGNFVLVSNFYATIGRWDSVGQLRSIMEMKGLAKEVGSSWVTDSKSHEGDFT